MLDAAVNEDSVTEQLGKSIHMAGLPGTASTIWYAMIKNNIVVAEHQPEYLIIFFRDSLMTVPGYRVTGRYLELVDEFVTPADTLLIERAYINQMTPLERFMEAYVPLYGARWIIRESIDHTLAISLKRVGVTKCVLAQRIKFVQLNRLRRSTNKLFNVPLWIRRKAESNALIVSKRQTSPGVGVAGSLI